MDLKKAVYKEEETVILTELSVDPIKSASDLLQEMKAFCAEMNVSLQTEIK